MGAFEQIHHDAGRYSPAAAAERYVLPPTGMPSPDQNYLIIGPRGAGKTIMLKTMFSRWSARGDLLPAYIELDRWIQGCASEVGREEESVTPRVRVMTDCLRLATAMGLIHGVAKAAEALIGQDLATQIVVPALQYSNLSTNVEEAVGSVRKTIRRCITGSDSGAPEPPHIPAVAEILGEQARAVGGRELVLLVDQIDQAPSRVFGPVISLLRRHTHCIAILATRPCPTAPQPAFLPGDCVAGDSYQAWNLDRESLGDPWQRFLGEVLAKLPLDGVQSRLQESVGVLANLTWPSLRSAIRIAKATARMAPASSFDVAWQQALADEAASHENLVESALSAWCDPHAVLRDWRKRAVKNAEAPEDIRSGKVSIRAFTRLKLQADVLFEVAPTPASRLIRVALQAGVLSPTRDAPYVLDHIPRRLEVSPLLFYPILPGVPTTARTTQAVWDTTKEQLKPLMRAGFAPKAPRLKRLFVSHWMSDWGGDSPELFASLSNALHGVIDVRTGASVDGNLSTTILSQLKECDAVVCDFGTPRREVYVEYGWAIGNEMPVLHVVVDEDCIERLPHWLAHLTVRPYGRETEREALAARVRALLSRRLSTEEQFKSLGPTTLRRTPEPNVVSVLTSAETEKSVLQRCRPLIEEHGFVMRHLVINSNDPGMLAQTILAARCAGSLVIALDGSEHDYLGLVAAAILHARPSMRTTKAARTRPKARKKVQYSTKLRTVFVLPTEPSLGLPKLLTGHPRTVVTADYSELRTKLGLRIAELSKWLRAAGRKTT